jgi:pSer/pThr/pTyr-binding forkhead associated (FHA) protein
VVVAQPRVSGRHCRFTEPADGYLVEDLGSSNGPYVNGERIRTATRVSAIDAITLGALVRMPWTPTSGIPCARVIRIGREEDNDIVLDDPMTSCVTSP